MTVQTPIRYRKLELWAWSGVLAFPLQVLALVVVQLGNNLEATYQSPGNGAFACSNFIHGSTPFRCSFSHLVSNAALGALLYDIFTFGVALVPAILVAALLITAVRRVRSRP